MIFEVFNQNSKYYKQMMEIILNAKNNPPEKGQVHHIIPRCWFKHFHQEVDNSISNTVLLSYEDHKLVHQLAYKCAKEPWFYNKMRHASTFYFGESPMTGHKHTDETKEKLRAAAIKQFSSIENRQKTKITTKEAMKNVPYEKLAYWLGKKHSDEYKQKLSKIIKQKRHLASIEYKKYKQDGGNLSWNEWNHERSRNEIIVIPEKVSGNGK